MCEKVLIVILVLFTWSCMSNNFGQPKNVKKLTLNSDELRNIIIDSILDDNTDNYDFDRSVLVLNIKKKTDYFEIRAGLLHKDDFKWYLKDKNDIIYGYLNYKNILILVFGASSNIYFSKHNESIEFDFLRIDPDIKKNDGLTLPPIIFEPEIRVFKSKKNSFELIEKGMLYLLK